MKSLRFSAWHSRFTSAQNRSMALRWTDTSFKRFPQDYFTITLYILNVVHRGSNPRIQDSGPFYSPFDPGIGNYIKNTRLFSSFPRFIKYILETIILVVKSNLTLRIEQHNYNTSHRLHIDLPQHTHDHTYSTCYRNTSNYKARKSHLWTSLQFICPIDHTIKWLNTLMNTCNYMYLQ